MSIRVISVVWKARLPKTKKLVLLRLADSASDDGGQAYPSVDTMAAECGLSRRTVQLVLRRLEADALITPGGSTKGGRGRTTVYQIDLERLQELRPKDEETAHVPRGLRQQKGAAPAGKGAAPAPEPSRTVKKLAAGAARAALPDGRAGVASRWEPVKKRLVASQLPGAEWLGSLELLPSKPGELVLRAPSLLIRDEAKAKLREPLVDSYAIEGVDLHDVKFVMPGEVRSRNLDP